MRETSTSEGGNYPPPPILPAGLNFEDFRWNFLHAAKLGHGTYYLTSHPKEVILWIFRMPEKSNGFGRVCTRELGNQTTNNTLIRKHKE
jgi:hypothetical protein